MDQHQARQLASEIEQLLTEVEQSAPPAVTARVEDLLRSLLGLYGAGLDQVLGIVARSDRPDLVRTLADDELVGSLLVLHDLHPDDVTTRVQAALDRVRPYLGSHAGGVELLAVSADGVAHLRLEGSCDGCPSSAQTVSNAIEDAILSAAPDVVSVEVEGLVAEPTLLQIAPFAGVRDSPAPLWVPLDGTVAADQLRGMSAGAEELVVAGLPDGPVAYLDSCPGCREPLSLGGLENTTLQCAGCHHRFDLRHAGSCLTDPDLRLVPVPMLPAGDGWQVSPVVPVTS